MKKLLLTLLGLLAILPAFPLTFTYSYEGTTLSYETLPSPHQKEVAVYSFVNMNAEVVIPNEVKYQNKTYPVTAIRNSAFSGLSFLTSITLPESVNSIGNSAFEGCSGLTSIIIPNNVRSIGQRAFYSCSRLTSVTMGNSVNSIGESAFYGCSGITSITIPESVYSIGSSAFSGCSGLNSITIPESVTSISEKTFDGCSGLTSVTIPESVYSIGSRAFFGCTGLTSIKIPESLNSIGSSAFFGCSGLTSVTIPESVESIGEYAFRECSLLTSVVIGNSVKSIGKAAFYRCPLLNSVIIGNSVASIDEYAFSGCTGLTSIKIPDSVKSIGARAFEECSGLNSVIIPPSVQTIGAWAFYECNGLVKSAYPNTISTNPFYYHEWTQATIYYGIAVAYNPEGAIIEEGWIYGPEKSSVRFVPYTFEGEYVAPESVTGIGNGAFSGCEKLTAIKLGNQVEIIGEGAFKNCSKLEDVTLGESLKSIGKEAFSYTPLTQITIPNSVETIGSYAFYQCTGLTSVTIPNSVNAIGSSTFYGCTGLTSVIIPNSVNSIGKNAFQGCYSLVKSAYPSTFSSNPIPNGVSVAYNPEGAIIENGWIYGPEKSSVRFAPYTLEGEYVAPESVKAIEHEAFRVCEKLTAIKLGDQVETIVNGAFKNCSKLEDVTLGESLKSIGDDAFSYTPLTQITIPNSVKTIGYRAFEGCTALNSVNVSWEMPVEISKNTFSTETYDKAKLYATGADLMDYLATNWSNFQNICINGISTKNYSDDVLKYRIVENPDNREAYVVKGDYSSLRKVEIPERFTDLSDPENPVRYYITAIAPDAFSNTKITTLEFNTRSIVDRIGARAFQGCSNLQSITFPESLRTIGNSSFKESGLTRLSLPEGLQTIGDYAFAECKKLENVSIPGSLKNVAFHSFYNDSTLNSLTIHEGVESVGISAFQNCSALKNLTIPGSVKILGTLAFAGTATTSLNLQEGLEIIHEGAFYAIPLEAISIPSSVTEIGKDAFGSPSDDNPSDDKRTKLDKVEIPNINDWLKIKFGNQQANPLKDNPVFIANGEEVTSLEIPAGTESINAYTFYGYEKLKKVVVPPSVAVIGENAISSTTAAVFEDGYNAIEIGSYNFTSVSALSWGRPWESFTIPASGLSSLVIGNSLTEVPAERFKDRKYLSKLTLGASLKEIGDNAFSGCTGIREVIVPPLVETIGVSAFEGDSKLNRIVIGHSIKQIGDRAFYGCPAGTISITAPQPPTATNNTFSTYTGELWLQGQKAVGAYYDAYTCWDRFNGYVMIEPTDIVTDGKVEYDGEAGEQFQLTATLMPENVTLPDVFWYSTNPEYATVDQNGVVTLQQPVPTRAAEGTCQIVASSLYEDGPKLVFTVTNNTAEVETILSDRTQEGDIDYFLPYSVYNLNGMMTGHTIEGLAPGIYIVRQGSASRKVVVK